MAEFKYVVDLGFKFMYKDETHSHYAKFGKINIILAIKHLQDDFVMTHDKTFSDETLLSQAKATFMTETPDIKTWITKTHNFIIECFEGELMEFKDELAIPPDAGSLPAAAAGTSVKQKVTDTDLKKISPAPDLPIVKHTDARPLYIAVWGIALRKKVPDDRKTQHNFNAAVLHGNRRFRENARDSKEARDHIMKGRAFYNFMEIMVNLIETRDYHRISINCTKGRHRSVTCAIALKDYYYPKAIIEYLDIS
ncbi:MAG: RNase adaptor protein [Hyperionvirus sp.]|uniref:RNase adaptor protein n=1 Tax=Hyperionvirus sp. TaxID=2487770 RepID=A0A3G5A704_9VIRU|nr:MAG: RNase adaptor protein [Hyperionvirus sp.]